MSDITSCLVAFYDKTSKQQAEARKHVEKDLHFLRELSEYIVPKIAELWKNPQNLCHVIAVGTYACEILDWDKFVWTGISCECRCERIEKGHVHLIGYINASRKQKSMFFKGINEKLGYEIKERSSMYHKCIELKNVQHILSAVLYIIREQQVYKRTMDVVCKHHNFLPWGLTKYALFMPGRNKKLIWDLTYDALTVLGFGAEVELCKDLYEKYSDAKRTATNARRAPKRAMPGTSYSDSPIPSKRTAPNTERTILERTGLAEDLKATYALIRDDPELGTNLCDLDTAERIICFLRQNPTEIVGGLRDFVMRFGPKAKDSIISREQQCREELPSEEPVSTPVDNGND